MDTDTKMLALRVELSALKLLLESMFLSLPTETQRAVLDRFDHEREHAMALLLGHTASDSTVDAMRLAFERQSSKLASRMPAPK